MYDGKTDFLWLVIALIVFGGVVFMLMWWPWGSYMSGMMGMMGFGWGLMFLIPLAFLALIALGAYYLITEFTGTGRSASKHHERAFEILKERYAKGEITREQYFKMKKELES